MKTLKKNTLVTKKDGTLKQRTIEAIDLLVKDTIIHPSFYTGSGRYIRLVSYEHEITTLLNMLGYKYKKGNNAPKGGKQGDYIKISKTALKTIKNLCN